MVEIRGHDNGLDVKLKEEGRTRVLLDVVIIGLLGKECFFVVLVFCLLYFGGGIM